MARHRPFTRVFSDWTLNGGGTTPIAGNLIAVKSPYRNMPGGKETVQTDVFYTDVALQPGKTIQSVSLPSQGGLHVFAVATTASPPAGQPAAPAYNNIGTSDDAAPASGNFDGSNSYSAQALQAAGVTPGATLTINGVQFTWPTAASGTANNYLAAGQTLPLQPAANVQAIAFLGAATYGTQSGTATIIYTDGTTQTVTLPLATGPSNGGGATPVAGNRIAIATPYRNAPTGRETVKTNVYYTSVPVQAGKTAQSVTLPSMAGLHVFAVGVKTSYPYNNIGTSNDAAPASGNFDGASSYSAQALAGWVSRQERLVTVERRTVPLAKRRVGNAKQLSWRRVRRSQ